MCLTELIITHYKYVVNKFYEIYLNLFTKKQT
jgi:hypothetical protein